MKRMLTVLAAVMAAAVSQMAMAAVSIKVSADKQTADFEFDASSLSRKLFIAYGNADAGGDTNAWENCEQVATVEPNTTSLVGVALTTGFGTDYFAMRAFLEKQGTAKDYVAQDDLIVLYDSRENADWGMFDNTATSWRNLVSDDRGTDMPLISGDGFRTADTYLVTGNGRLTESAVAGADDNLTIEFNMKPPATSGQQTWLAQVVGLARVGFYGGNGTFEVGYPYNGNYYYRWFGSFPTDSAYHTYTARNFNKSGNPWTNVKLDGVSKNQSGEWGSGDSASSKTYQMRLGAFNHALNLRSVRIYRRALTDAEIAQNRAVDVSRFDGGKFLLESSDTKLSDQSPRVVKVNKAADEVTPVSIVIVFPPTNIERKVCIGWGKKDKGADLNAWDNAVILGNAPANAITMTVPVPSEIGSQLVRRGYRIFIGYTTAKDYVQTGLALLYDCRENVGWGTFDAASQNWHNLVSDGTDTDLGFSSQSSPPNKFETDNAHCARSIYRKSTASTVAEGRTSHTLELNMKPNPANISGPEQWFALVGGLGRVGFRSNTGTLEVAYPQKKSGVDEYDYVWRWYDGFPTDGGYHTYTAQFGNPGSWPETWADGVKKNQATDSYGWNAGAISDADYKFKLGLDTNQTDLELRSIRLYSKALTPDEVAQNRKVDVARFEGGLPINTVATDFVRTNWGLCITVR